MFLAMDACARWIRERSAASFNPSQVQTSLVQLSEQWPESAQSLIEVVVQFPLGEAALLHLFAVLSICEARLTRYLETLMWISTPNNSLDSTCSSENNDHLHALTRYSC